MQKYYSSLGLSIAAETTIKYGKEDTIKDSWKTITEIENDKEREEKINNILQIMESNKENNGFIARDDVVRINKIGNAFKLDDTQLYYSYFETLKKFKEKFPNEPDGRIVFFAIRATIDTYFGGTYSNRDLRMSLTEIDITDEGAIIPSISLQKGKSCSLCVERASVAHNLWLLAGEQSHYVNSLDCKFEDTKNEYSNDGHAFCIVEIDGVYKLFDPTMQIYKKLEDNPIDKMLKGEPFKVSSKDGREYTYANASCNNIR